MLEKRSLGYSDRERTVHKDSAFEWVSRVGLFSVVLIKMSMIAIVSKQYKPCAVGF